MWTHGPSHCFCLLDGLISFFNFLTFRSRFAFLFRLPFKFSLVSTVGSKINTGFLYSLKEGGSLKIIEWSPGKGLLAKECTCPKCGEKIKFCEGKDAIEVGIFVCDECLERI